MKNRGILSLMMLTVLFIGFMFGFFIGRNTSSGDILIAPLGQSTAPTDEKTLPAAPSGSDPATVATAPSSSQGDLSGTEPEGKVNINTATVEQLMKLPGIGQVLAGRIIAYRQENGAFQSIYDLLLVSGIGEKRLDAIIDYLTV